ncbi:hypothetical protein FVE85_2989 [Porphyridium purpureum]|uniref:Uncharacterized protein n=1 Tax=Porphyridium purpureum TaxID=35688 RepID=A0A5J4YU82_PORPP|nr:hypothetical protein FVE85_2989 [Porphyridium purpureum]|eukprot:POR0795..scf227_4
MAFAGLPVRPAGVATRSPCMVRMCQSGSGSGPGLEARSTTRRDLLSGMMVAALALTAPQAARADRNPAQVREARDRYLPRIEALRDALLEARELLKQGKTADAAQILEGKVVVRAQKGMDILPGIYSDSAISERTYRLKQLNGLIVDAITQARQASAAGAQAEAETALADALQKLVYYCAGVQAKSILPSI